ncbi:MAG: hypothetical protein IE916_04900 [Epsilonproteobacteria bacterium]|nr:hypothetical protein [Campylobacterota bacterium]
MNPANQELFSHAKTDELCELLKEQLIVRKESPFWADKVIPFTRAVMSALVPLQKQNLLFNPEGVAQERLTFELFYRWCDMVSLKSLYFTLKRSNEKGELVGTRVESSHAKSYKQIDLGELESYLQRYNINTQNESLDFPIANYNLHIGVANVIKSLL